MIADLGCGVSPFSPKFADYHLTDIHEWVVKVKGFTGQSARMTLATIRRTAVPWRASLPVIVGSFRKEPIGW